MKSFRHFPPAFPGSTGILPVLHRLEACAPAITKGLGEEGQGLESLSYKL